MKITGLDEERHDRRWNGQRALVTGAGQGIGRAVAQLLASKGVKVAVNDIVPERAENTVKLIADAGGEAFAAIGDIADPTVVEDHALPMVASYLVLRCFPGQHNRFRRQASGMICQKTIVFLFPLALRGYSRMRVTYSRLTASTLPSFSSTMPPSVTSLTVP